MFDWYFKALQHPIPVLLIFLCLSLVAVSGVVQFRFDASSDSLVVQGDPKLIEYNRMSTLFGSDDFVVLTYHRENLFSDDALNDLAELQFSMARLPGIASTYSILDAPLIESPPIPLDMIAENYLTLSDPDIDRAMAKIELTKSSLFENYLIARDAKTTAVSGTLKRDLVLEALSAKRDALSDLATEETREVELAYAAQLEIYNAKRETLIAGLRAIRQSHPQRDQIFISGVPMIAADMLSYVKSDLQVFGVIVFVLIVGFLFVFFRKLRWVALPLLICITSVAITIGVLGLLGTPVTVVSSNFISLLSIISISFSIHLVVRYRELFALGKLNHEEMVLETMRSKFAPCLYTALTTLLAFGSMLMSGIVPIVDFGWMMCLGIVIALVVTYIIFPTVLLLLGGAQASATLGDSVRMTTWFQNLSIYKTRWVLLTGALLFVASFVGAAKLEFDNRFVDYFHEQTDIRQGMVQIDRNLGGTLPLDIYIRFEPFELYEDDFSAQGDTVFPERYWFTPDKIEVLRSVQTRLEQQPEIGKVLSLASVEKIARGYNDGEALTGMQLVYLLGELPEAVRSFLIDPYSDPASGWMRVNARISESQYVFSKEALVKEIEDFLITDMSLDAGDVVVTGMIVLFSDMLKQLADSQIRTLGYVIGATLLMFAVLLRSLKLAFIALVPNVLAALLVLAFMGYAGISMDMMTVTIAAICIGIGVDDAVHYLHRFRLELQTAESTSAAVIASHQTIGRAMYFTTMTVMGGFSILAFSNFVPTVYFGLLTSMAMGFALVANMVLLPSLLMTFCAPTRGDL
ncbi:MAG: putative RND superfamily exporter protein [Sulfitobacter sp.]|jgi:predicted RND superfamily exporter protein